MTGSVDTYRDLSTTVSQSQLYTAIVQTLGSQAGKLDLSHVTSTIMDEDSRQPWRSRNPAKCVQCYNCEKLGHFSRDCPEPPKHHHQLSALTHRGGSRPKTTSDRKPHYKARVAVMNEAGDPDEFCFCTSVEEKFQSGRVGSGQEKVHSDVCGPMQTACSSGKKYMVTFVDDYFRSCTTYMAHKSDTFVTFQQFHAKVTWRNWRENRVAEDRWRWRVQE